MNSRVTMALAGVMLLGAVFAGYWGIRMSQDPEPAQDSVNSVPATAALAERVSQAADDVQRQKVVVAARDLPPFTSLTADDLTVESVRAAPPGSLSSIDQVIGRQLWTPLPAGSWLSGSSFEAGGPLSRMIKPDERAVALAVDEVISAGGFLSPGDYVDVLLVMQDEGGNRQRSAQVALPALRLLSLGEALGPALDGKPTRVPAENEQGSAARSQPRTAVLAVPQEWVPRLMLASQAGTLRLAVRSAEEKLLARYQAGESMPVALDEKTRALLPLTQLGLRSAATPSVQNRAVATPGRNARVEVLRAGQSSWHNP